MDPEKSPGATPRRGRGALHAALVATALAAAPLPAEAVAKGLNPNPANDLRLLNRPIEGERYDDADSCRKQVPPGMKALERWLERNVRGESWGIHRCERLKRGGFSLHSENRAIDWHLDSGVAKDRRAAMRLIRTLLASDRHENERALARRMGVQGLIYDCKAWWSGMDRMGPYSYCYKRNGDLRHDLDRTAAHRDHVHIELNWEGARKHTSFWRSRLG